MPERKQSTRLSNSILIARFANPAAHPTLLFIVPCSSPPARPGPAPPSRSSGALLEQHPALGTQDEGDRSIAGSLGPPAAHSATARTRDGLLMVRGGVPRALRRPRLG